jgi:hypothetical protein
MKNIQGITQITTSGLCTDPFPLGSQQSCTLSLNVNGSALAGNVVGGPVVCQQGSNLQCYQPSAQDSLNITVVPVSPTTTLFVSMSELALQTSGTSRTLMITNLGSHTAENLTLAYPTWPSGTSATSDCGSALSLGSSCTVTITPGANATSDCDAGQGSEPTPGVIFVNADNASTVSTNVFILTYGCIYQEGFIFEINDTTASTDSIAGATASLTDVNIADWGSDTISTGASSLVDGLTNTALIIMTEPSSGHAANFCSEFEIDSSGNTPCATGTCYTNWYLPAVCQMGSSLSGAGCTSGTPSFELNLQNLITGCSGSSCLSAEHWSSTEFSTSNAWYVYFQSSGSIQQQANKGIPMSVRCARDFN